MLHLSFTLQTIVFKQKNSKTFVLLPSKNNNSFFKKLNEKRSRAASGTRNMRYTFVLCYHTISHMLFLSIYYLEYITIPLYRCPEEKINIFFHCPVG
ncbi:MAG TPA: hypothetical protein DD738_14280 [Ruminiclostridium sp.]|nr:hypothetical protein [Ruminiclostridium sp.]